MLFSFPIPEYAKEIIVDQEFRHQSLGRYVDIYEDYSKEMTINDIVNNQDLEYYQINNNQLFIGHRRDAFVWVRLQIKNKSGQFQSLVHRTNDYFIRSMDGFLVRRDSVIAEFPLGLGKTFHTRDIPLRHSAFIIEMLPDDELDVYLKIDGRLEPMHFPICLSTARYFFKRVNKEYAALGLLHGCLVVVIILALILFAATRMKLFLLYFLYALFISYSSFCIAGFDYQYLFPNHPNIVHHNKLFFALLSFLFLYALVVEYFKQENEDIRFTRMLSFIIYPVGIVALVITMFQDTIFNTKSGEFTSGDFTYYLSILAGIILYTICRVVFKNPRWNNVLFFIAYLGLIITAILSIFINSGVIEIAFDATLLTYSSILLELTFISILMVKKILDMRNERFELNIELEKAKLEKVQVQKIKELDQAKTRLYTNITHEFRTPLTVIKGITSQISGNDSKKELIDRNSNILLRLINQLLSLSKADKGELRLQLIQSDIIKYLKYLGESFKSWGRVKNIRLHFLPEIAECTMDFDPDKIQEILGNLLSNAIKYTEEGGDVYIIVKSENGNLVISVKDSGVGIPTEAIPHIFDRFYQVRQSDDFGDVGSGIGLALCKELATLMNGKVEVESKIGIGSKFTVVLPITNQADLKDNPIAQSSLIIPQEEAGSYNQESDEKASMNGVNADQETILIVEDNKDVRHYISICLSDEYQLILANNGVAGIEQAIEIIPDLVISDVMMPLKTGLELCEEIKTNYLTSHIPVILLTAKADQKAKLQGLMKGADAYLAKPFDEEELLTRVKSLIEQRKRIQKHFLRSTNKVQSPKYKAEQEFLKKVKSVIMGQINNELFDVQWLARDMTMSRSQLYRKVKALTGKSIAGYIRFLRLQEGKRLLESTDEPISEIAFQVGFNDLSYFSSSFSEEFGFPPGATRK